MIVEFKNFKLYADKALYEAMVEKYGTQSYGDRIAIKTNNSFASWMSAEKIGDKYEIVPISSQNNERQSLQMEAYWTVLKEFPIREFNNVPQFYKQWFVNRGLMKEEKERDYKDEYKKFQSSDKMKKYRAELNKYNRDKGTYGNGDGKDASHKGGKISGFEDESTNKGRREKSRLKKENVKMGITRERLYEIIVEEYQHILKEEYYHEELAKKLIKDKKVKKGMKQDDMIKQIAIQSEKDLGKKRARYYLRFDEDFLSDAISSIGYYLKKGVKEGIFDKEHLRLKKGYHKEEMKNKKSYKEINNGESKVK